MSLSGVIRRRYTMPLLGVTVTAASKDVCAAQAYLATMQGLHQTRNHSRKSIVGIPADTTTSGSGLGSRWHALLQALEYTTTHDLRLVLLDRGRPGFPYLSRHGCLVASERCYFQPFDFCGSCDTCKGLREVGSATWKFPGRAQNQTRFRGVIWEASVPHIFATKRTLLWWQAQAVMFFLQPTDSTIRLLDEHWLHGARRTGNRIGKLRNFSSWSEFHPYISMHVRWGDKCWREAKCKGAREYARAAEQLRQEFGVTRLVLSSEDPDAIKDIPAALSDDWEVFWTEGDRFGAMLKNNLPMFESKKEEAQFRKFQKQGKTGVAALLNASEQGGAKKAANAQDVAAQSVINFFVSSAADYIICTPSSNWCRIYVKMACALRNRCPPTVFMDKWANDFTMSEEVGMQEEALRYFF